MESFALYRKKILTGAVLAIIVAVMLATSAIWIVSSDGSQKGDTSSGSVVQSQLIIELTDPPIVPQGSSSLNLTYTEISLSVVEPGTNALQSFVIVPGGNSATVNLLDLQNVSQTLALSSLENGSEIVSASFVVSNIELRVNGTSFPVSLATGGNILLVSTLGTAPLQGSINALLIEFNPTIINGSTGYELVPSSLGVLKPQSELTVAEARVGHVQGLTGQDQNDLHRARGSVQAELTYLSVSGDITTMNIQVTNTGTSPERLVLFGIRGYFAPVCSTISQDYPRHDRSRGCRAGRSEVVLIPGEPHVPSTTTTTITSCAPRHMSLVNQPDIQNDLTNPIVMNPGQCLMFSFSGEIFTFGNHAVVPSTKPGEELTVHVFASNGADTKLQCTFQKSNSFPSCTTENDQGSDT